MRLDILNGDAFLIDAIPGRSLGLQGLGPHRHMGFDKRSEKKNRASPIPRNAPGLGNVFVRGGFSRLNSFVIGLARFPIRKRRWVLKCECIDYWATHGGTALVSRGGLR